MREAWHELPKSRWGEIHAKLFPYLRDLEQRQSYLDREAVVHLGLYEDREVVGVAPGLYFRPAPSVYASTRVSLPITGALCDTATNHIAQTKPLPMATTEGGDWLQQQHAKDLNRFLQAHFYELSIHETMQISFGDCTWNGTGWVYVDREGRKPVVERVFPGQMLIDQALCQFSDPYEMTRRFYLPKDKLKRLFPKHAAAIDKAAPAKLHGISSKHAVEIVPVYTTWRLPLDEKHPGKKVTIIEGVTLQCDPYTKDYFPFVSMRWRRQAEGFLGRGIPSIGKHVALDINKNVKTMSRSVALCAIPRLLLPIGSNINPEAFNTDIGSGLWHSPGMAPSWMGGQSVPPEGMSWVQFLLTQYYQIVGISELAAGMRKPAGLNSGEAQRVYNDTQANRFALPSQGYENAAIEIGKRLVDVARDIAEEFGDYAVMHASKKGFRRINWSEIAVEKDDVTYQLWPINFLSKSPADLVEQINDLIKIGLLTGKQARRLVPFPDLEAVLQQENASEELIQMIIEKIVEYGEYVAPDPVQDLEGSIKTVQQAKVHYMTLGLPQERLDMLDAWISNAQLLLPPAPAPMPTPPPGADIAGLPPPAPTMAPPPALAG